MQNDPVSYGKNILDALIHRALLTAEIRFPPQLDKAAFRASLLKTRV